MHFGTVASARAGSARFEHSHPVAATFYVRRLATRFDAGSECQMMARGRRIHLCPAWRCRRDRHEPVDLWFRQSPAAGLACGRSRRVLWRRRTSSGHRHHHARHQLSRAGAEESGRACADARPRGPFRRHHRPLAEAEMPDLCDEIQRRAVRGQMRGRTKSAEDPGHCRALRQPDRARALWCRVHSGGALDSGIACVGHSHGGGNRSAYWRLEARSDAGRRPANRRAPVARTWRSRRTGPDRRFHQRRARGPLALGDRSRQDHHRTGEGR